VKCKVIYAPPTRIEKKINDWLSEMQIKVDINRITQSESCTTVSPSVTVIFWYEEK